MEEVKIKEIKEFEKLESGKFYITYESLNRNKYSFICQVISKENIGLIYGFKVKIIDNNLNFENKQKKITYPEFRNYNWFEITEDELMVELL